MLDTHCHLNDTQYDGEVGHIVDRFLDEGVEKVICVGCDTVSNEKAKQIADTYDSVYYAVGIHPDECMTYDEDKLVRYLDSNDKKLVAIGEIGLDYYHNKENKAKQKEVFVRQIKLAKKYHLPIIIHCRDAYGDMLDILREYAPFDDGAVMHCFSGSVEWANEIIRLGIKISFTGSVTFKNAKNLHEVAKHIPLDTFFFETDSPYLSPEPNRGKRNEPKRVFDVLKFVAELRGLSAGELEKITDINAKNFFKIN
ncbi:MAG: TatD family deoxyribonuclease [Clostridiales bacterium]|nr:TatD family deoxyribonuclease [Clostridiales bacterium]